MGASQVGHIEYGSWTLIFDAACFIIVRWSVDIILCVASLSLSYALPACTAKAFLVIRKRVGVALDERIGGGCRRRRPALLLLYHHHCAHRGANRSRNNPFRTQSFSLFISSACWWWPGAASAGCNPLIYPLYTCRSPTARCALISFMKPLALPDLNAFKRRENCLFSTNCLQHSPSGSFCAKNSCWKISKLQTFMEKINLLKEPIKSIKIIIGMALGRESRWRRTVKDTIQ